MFVHNKILILANQIGKPVWFANNLKSLKQHPNYEK